MQFLASKITTALIGALFLTAAVDGEAATERRGYADGKFGQVHYRRQGEGPTVVLVHQTPWYSVQFAKVQPLMTAAGYASIAIDTPGSGFSPAPARALTLPEYADEIAAVVRAVAPGPVTLVGDHTGAGIAVLAASRHPDLVRCLVAYGMPLYESHDRERKIAAFPSASRLRPDGSHLIERFNFVRDRILGGHGSIEGIHWSTIAYMLMEDADQTALRALFKEPALDTALGQVRARGLLLSSPEDTLHAGTMKARKLRPDFGYHEFRAGGSHLSYDDPETWVAPIVRFMKDSCTP